MQELTSHAAIELRGIDKSFGSVQAVRGVSLRIEHGSITGIVGENGAGKSTLMSILYGLYRADAGEIRVEGRPVEMTSPRDAIGQGIGMVHQHFMLVDSFTVLENLILGTEGGPLLAGGLAAARTELARLAFRNARAKGCSSHGDDEEHKVAPLPDDSRPDSVSPAP